MIQAIFLASAFGTFAGFVFAGLLALAVTAMLDRRIGKERALFLYSLALLAFALVQCRPDAQTVRARVRAEDRVPAGRLDIQGDPVTRPPLVEFRDGRNPFQKHSDTHRLPPVELPKPPWLPLAFALPPTVPGPVPGHRGALDGAMPRLAPGDGTTIAAVPDPKFTVYEPTADDVYDWGIRGGRKTWIYIRSIFDEGVEHKEGTPGYEARKWMLAWSEGNWQRLMVEYALIPDAPSKLAPEAVVEWRRKNVTRDPVPADHFDEWHVRRSVANLFVEALRAAGVRSVEDTEDVGALRAAAATMAEVGRTGKESKAGWRQAALLLERALEVAREREGPAVRAEILQELVDAYVALRDEQAVLRTLSEYARTSPRRPEPWVMLGRIHLRSLRLPADALVYFDAALQRDPRNADALLGRAETLSALGANEEALDAARRAGAAPGAKTLEAEALLRLGKATEALAAADRALQTAAGDPRALLARGAALYVLGRLPDAQAAFQRAATAVGEDGLRWRAEACYDLGLACWRQGQADAALAAFDACDHALQFGAEPGRYADETVSPDFGRALVALAAGQEGTFLEHLAAARASAPRVAYHEMLAGMVALDQGDDEDQGNVAAAARAFEGALALDPRYTELDGWLALTKLRIGQQVLRTSSALAEAEPLFRAAVAFAQRAAARAAQADRKAYADALREAWILLDAEHLTVRQRYESARAVVDGILSRVDNEQPGALTIRGYCNYKLGDVDQCLRDFQLVVDAVPDEDGPWKPWRDYAQRALAAVKHWNSLEEKVVSFSGTALPPDWPTYEGAGAKVRLEDGALTFLEDADKDGSLTEPTVSVKCETLFEVGSFEEVRLLLRIPPRNERGEAMNNVTFGVQVQRAAGRSATGRHPGLGVFYDKGKMALRVGTGRDEAYRDGALHRVVPEQTWPGEDFVEVRIARGDEPGEIEVFLDPRPDGEDPNLPWFSDVLSGFREGTRGKAELWIGGYASQAQRFDVEVKEIRVIRRTE